MTEHDGVRWVFDRGDSFVHVLADPAAESGVLVTRCGRQLPIEHTPTFSVAPIWRSAGYGSRPVVLRRLPAVFPAPTHY